VEACFKKFRLACLRALAARGAGLPARIFNDGLVSGFGACRSFGKRVIFRCDDDAFRASVYGSA
jgi:hypothetical protein